VKASLALIGEDLYLKPYTLQREIRGRGLWLSYPYVT